jgi:hypothetical protein
MAAHSSKIIFHTDSPEYLCKLIPKRYHTNGESTESGYAFTLRDRSLLQVNSIHQKVVFGVDVLDKLFWLGPIIVPTLPGAPELNINLDLVPTSVLPAIQNIIGNAGCIEYHQLDSSDRVCHISPGEVTGNIEAHLQSPTNTSTIINVLRQIRGEGHNADKGVWLFDEQLVAATEFLEALKVWASPEAYRQGFENKCGTEAVTQNLDEFCRFCGLGCSEGNAQSGTAEKE